MVSSGDEDWRTSWYYEYNYEKQFPYTPNVRALRTDRWKYIRYMAYFVEGVIGSAEG